MLLFRFLFGYARHTSRILIFAILAGFISGASSVGLLALIHRALEEREGGILIPFAASFAGLCILVTVSRVLSQYLLEKLSQGTMMSLRLDLVRQILDTPLLRIESLGNGRLLATLTTDVNAVNTALANVPVISINGAILLGCFAYMIWLDWRIFSLLALVILGGAASYYLPTRLAMSRFRRARRKQDALYEHFEGVLQGIKELKLHQPRRSGFMEMVKATTDHMRQLNIDGTLFFSLASSWGHLLFFVVIGVLIFSPPVLSSQLNSELIVGYILVILYMMTPLQVFLNAAPALGRANVAVKHIQDLELSLSQETSALPMGESGGGRGLSGSEPWNSLKHWNSLELVAVTHTYFNPKNKHHFTLGPIDFSFKAGEVVFMVGGNGSGKTTLAKLLTGLYEPEAGHILVNGEKIEEETRHLQRNLFSTVFFDFYLFEHLHGFGKVELESQARQYLSRLEIEEKVSVENGKLSTLHLSQGQRRRLALMTAYLENRPIYLFDEWAADQDPVFKECFYFEIIPELRESGKTVIVISHDDRYFHIADRVLKLENGKIASEKKGERVDV